MKILAFDVGSVRTGAAVCDESETLASPVRVIVKSSLEAAAAEAVAIVAEYGAELAVIGLPVKTDGSEGESAIRAREFARILKQKSTVRIEFLDERFSTATAHRYYNEAGKKGAKKRRETVDAAAAAVILQSFLDKRKKSFK